MKNIKCSMPYNSMTIEAYGEVRLCTSSEGVVVDLKTSDASLLDIWQGPYYQEVKESFAQNQFPPSCSPCAKLEEQGLPSRRTAHSSHFESTARLKHLSVGFSNDCNLKCAMCGGLFSSAWGNEEKRALDMGLEFRTPYQYQRFEMSVQNRDELLKLSHDLETIFIKGGEPLLSPLCLDYLERISLLDHRPKIFIQTNATIFNERIKTLIESLDIDIGLSIDGIDKTYQWVRGPHFSVIEKNMEAFLKTQTRAAVFIDFTASLFNFCEIPEFISYMTELNLKNRRIRNISFTTIAKQDFNNLRVLPLELRQEVFECIETHFEISYEGFDNFKKYALAPQLDLRQQRQAKAWVVYLEKGRGPIPSRQNPQFLEWFNGL